MMGRTHQLAATAAAFAMAAAAAAQSTFDVTLEGTSFVFGSQTNMSIDLEIGVGDTVRWTWVSGFHNVVSGIKGDPSAGSLFISGSPVSPPMVFEHTFTSAGVFDYHCDVHAGIGMVSQVTVVDACYADCDGSGTLNILDYICFGDDFAAGGTYADCDGSGSLNILDYICFGDEFAAGCP